MVNGDVKYSMRNTVNNVATATYGGRWVLDKSRGSVHTLYKRLTTMLYLKLM